MINQYPFTYSNPYFTTSTLYHSGSEHVITHARNIPGIVRRKDNSRILKRQEEKEKKEQKKEQKQQELKRLKNLKRQELAEKLKKIQEMAGGDLVGLNEIDLEGDFDPEQHDERMDQIFADDYYSNMVSCFY